jgi:hypothetical protein
VRQGVEEDLVDHHKHLGPILKNIFAEKFGKMGVFLLKKLLAYSQYCSLNWFSMQKSPKTVIIN